MKKLLLCSAIALTVAGCEQADRAAPESNQAAAEAAAETVAVTEDKGANAAEAIGQALASNDALDVAGFDQSTRPQDDFFRYVNGGWLDSTEIPADKSRWGSFDMLAEQSRESVKAIIDDLAATANLPAGSDSQKVRDMYLSFMNEAKINELGAEPLQPILAKIDSLGDKEAAMSFLGAASRSGVSVPVNFFINQDAKDPETYRVYFTQGGLGLPDRDYYFDDSERGETIIAEYKSYLTQLFTLAGLGDAAARAERVFGFEKAMAEKQWTRVENRDRDKTYNKVEKSELRELAPQMAWGPFLTENGIDSEDQFIVRQPSYFNGLGEVWESTQLPVLKDYARARVINSSANALSQPFVDANFAFYGKTLRGQEQQEDRWKRGVNSVNGNLGELVGKEYVKRHFPPQAKQRMLELVGNLRKAMGQSIDELEWMTAETKKEAHAKLATFTPKIGYPDKWRDYSALEVKADDLFGNMRRAAEWQSDLQVAKLGQPIDRDEWFMSPQTVNAYYNPSMNEIVFPAAILQPPFFYLDADDAMNYGGIGMVIGHEIGHGFDDQGRKSDGKGVLRDWWTDEDAAEYTKRADRLVEQYGAFEPLEGQNLNGRLSLGENIGDLGGLALAWKAYQMSKEGKEPAKIDDFSGDQRFFLNYAQIWRSKYRDEALEQQIKTGPHSPPHYRVIGPLANFDPFYATFGVEQGDGMYMPEGDRVSIW